MALAMRTRQCRVLTVGNIHSNATGFDIIYQKDVRVTDGEFKIFNKTFL